MRVLIGTMAGACLLSACWGDEHASPQPRSTAASDVAGLPPWTGVPGTGPMTEPSQRSDIPSFVAPTTSTTSTTSTTTTTPTTSTTTSTTTPSTTASEPTTTTTLPPCETVVTTQSDLLFAPKRWELLPGAGEQLEASLAVLRAQPGLRAIAVFGHTDSRHPKDDLDYNIYLSQQRADTVKAFIVDRFGIDPLLITATGLAYTEPAVDDGGPEAATYREEDGRLNRRVVIKVYTLICATVQS